VPDGLVGTPAVLGSWVDQVDVQWDETEVSPPPTARWFETQAGRRLLVKLMGGLGLRCLFIGPCVGLCLGVAMRLSTGLIPSVVAVPLLVISVVLGAVVGGLLGIVGGAVLAWRKHDSKLKSVIDELSLARTLGCGTTLVGGNSESVSTLSNSWIPGIPGTAASRYSCACPRWRARLRSGSHFMRGASHARSPIPPVQPGRWPGDDRGHNAQLGPDPDRRRI
jgi:hypothetical protein